MDPLVKQMNNIYVIDTKFQGRFDHYMSAFLVKGDKLALIDAGQPPQLEVVRAGIKAHGFSVSDIDYIFVTHCEHPDHAGCVAPILKESPKAAVYINPIGMEVLTAPESINWAERVAPEFLSRQLAAIKGWQPVDPSRIQCLKDGDTVDLGSGEKLRVMFTPAHQPSGLVIFEEKNQGLFISDVVGNCFIDADAHYLLSPALSDHTEAIRVMKELMKVPLQYLYMGHYGITDKPQLVMSRAISKLETMLDLGRKCIREGKPEWIPGKYYETIVSELEKLKSVRGEEMYQYTQEHIIQQGKLFAKYCQEKFGPES